METNKQTGDKGEALAAEYLATKGFEILEKNWRFKNYEVDIIASKNKRLHFFEIKTRTSRRFGYPEESITYDKMNSLKNAAEEYQYRNPDWKYIQFDVLSITILPDAPIEYFYVEDVYF